MQTYVGYYTHASKSEWLRRVVPRMRGAMGLLCCLAAASAAQATTVQLEPLADNWINSCSTGCTVNYGDMDELRVRTSWWGPQGSKEPKNFRSLLRFDLSSFFVPADRITQATLNLYYYNYAHTDPAGRVYDVHGLASAWDEMHSTWQARDAHDTPDPVYWDSYYGGSPPYQPGGGDFAETVYASAVVPASAGQWVSWDVTSLVQEWVAGTGDNVGLVVKDNTEIEANPGGGNLSYLAKFRSREFAECSFRPYLEVTFEGVEPIPTVSEWGLVVMALSLLVAGKIRFGRGRMATTVST